MWKLIALVLAKWKWMKHVGRFPLKNFLILLLRDPHHLDGNPRCCSCTWWSGTWSSLGNPLDQGLRSFFKCINFLLKLVLAFLLVVLWWKIILSLCPFERSRIILLLLRNKLRLGVLIFFPLNSISIELSFKTNTLILPVPSLLVYNLLALLTPGKAFVNTFL